MKKLVLFSLLFAFALACNKEKDFETIPQSDILLASDSSDVWDTTFTLTVPEPAPLVGASRSLAYRLVIQNHLLYWSDNVPAKIVEVNSPETAFLYLDYQWMNWAHTNGANTLYLSVNNKESGKPPVTPYKNNQISQGFDDVKVDSWVAMAVYWCSLDERKILHILLSEKETHFLYTDAQRKAAMDYLVVKFAPVAGHIIWDREEWSDGQTAQANNLYSYLRGIDPVNIRAMHNNTNGKPWSGFYNDNSVPIQFLSFQAWSGSFDNQIRTEVSKFPLTVTGYASETTEGFAPNDVTKAETLFNAAPGYNAGAGVFIKCCDQRDTRDEWYEPYYPVFNRLAQLAGINNTPPDDTVVIPPATQYPLRYGTTSTRTPNYALQGATVPAGKIWAYIDVSTDIPNRPLSLYYDGTFINYENGRPYELGGGNGQNVTSGQHEVKVLNAQNSEIARATFTVSGIVIPPDTSGIVIKYAKSTTKLNEKVLTPNAVISPTGSYYFYTNTTTGVTITFWKNGALQWQRTGCCQWISLSANNNYEVQIAVGSQSSGRVPFSSR